jgi:hypothetical protein
MERPSSSRLLAVISFFCVFLATCDGLQMRKPATTCQRTSTRVFIGADYFGEDTTPDKSDLSIEAVLGSAHVSEYERDAEFYRKRNEAYSKSLLKEELPVVGTFEAVDLEQPTETSAAPLKASFDHVETSINSLLKGRPLVALGIFCAAGILVAYLSGFFFLEGYIENWNPAENDQIPYWEDAEIHTIQRAVQ